MTESPTLKDRAKGFGTKAWNMSYKVSDKLATYANAGAAEAFWPAAGDTPKEIEKCARILTDFTSRGVEETITKEVVDQKTGEKVKKQRKVIKKIPPAVIKQAKGLVIFTAFRTGIAPLGGAGGCGMAIARLADGSWSAPSSVMPQNLSAGFMFGVDIYDVVLVVRTEKAMASFYGHKMSLGAELAVVAGPVGAGAALDTGKEMVPCWSYVKSRGFYAGVEIAGTIMISRYDEMGRFYYTPGIRAGDILTGKVRMPVSLLYAEYKAHQAKAEAKVLHDAIAAAESLSETDAYESKADATEGVVIDIEGLDLDENETLHLPPTPAQMAMEEGVTFQESWAMQEKKAMENPDDELVYKREPPRPPPRRSLDPKARPVSMLASSGLGIDGSAIDGNSQDPSTNSTSASTANADSGVAPPIPQRRRPVQLSRQNSAASLHERIQLRRQNSVRGSDSPGLVRQNSNSSIHAPRRQEALETSSPIIAPPLRRQDSMTSVGNITSRLDQIGH